MVQTRGIEPRPISISDAARAMRRLIDDPDDTAQVFRIIRALSGSSFERLFQRDKLLIRQRLRKIEAFDARAERVATGSKFHSVFLR